MSSAICQSLFCQNIVSENLPKFNDVIVSRYTVMNNNFAILCY